MLDKPRDKYTDNDRKLEGFILSALKHKGIVANDATELPADKTNAVKEYISQNVSELPSKKAAAFFPEDLKQQYQAAKAKEKEIRAKQDNDLEKQTEKHKIKEALAAAPTLLSEIISGKKKSSDYSFNDVMQDLRNHPKSDSRMMMARLLHLSMQNNPDLTKESKIPQECMEKNIALLKKYQNRTAREPQLNFQRFLEQEGLTAQREKTERKHKTAPAKTRQSAVAETKRVSDKLRQNIQQQKNTAKPVPVQTKNITEEKEKLTPMQIALIKKRGNDFAR